MFLECATIVVLFDQITQDNWAALSIGWSKDILQLAAPSLIPELLQITWSPSNSNSDHHNLTFAEKRQGRLLLSVTGEISTGSNLCTCSAFPLATYGFEEFLVANTGLSCWQIPAAESNCLATAEPAYSSVSPQRLTAVLQQEWMELTERLLK